MHTINLGTDLWVIASVMKKLLEYDLFGGPDMDEGDRLLIAYDDFRTWARTNKVQPLDKRKVFISYLNTYWDPLDWFQLTGHSHIKLGPFGNQPVAII